MGGAGPSCEFGAWMVSLSLMPSRPRIRNAPFSSPDSFLAFRLVFVLVPLLALPAEAHRREESRPPARGKSLLVFLSGPEDAPTRSLPPRTRSAASIWCWESGLPTDWSP